MKIPILVLLLGFGCALTIGCGGSTEQNSLQDRAKQAAAITSIVKQDRAAHEQIVASIGVWDKIWGNPDKIAQYSTTLRNFDLSGCPQDFQDAFLKHAYAWGTFANVAESVAGIKGIVRGFNGADAEPEIQRAQKEITDTWLEVDQIARRYGVNVNQ